MNIKRILGIIVVIAVVVVLVVVGTRKKEAPVDEVVEDAAIVEEATEENTEPEAVEVELQGVDLGDLEEEWQGIDSDIEELEL